MWVEIRMWGWFTRVECCSIHVTPKMTCTWFFGCFQLLQILQNCLPIEKSLDPCPYHLPAEELDSVWTGGWRDTKSFLCFESRVEVVSDSSQQQLFCFEKATTSSSLKKAIVYFIYFNPNSNISLREELSIKSPDTSAEWMKSTRSMKKPLNLSFSSPLSSCIAKYCMACSKGSRTAQLTQSFCSDTSL